MYDALYRIDDLAFSRIVRATTLPISNWFEDFLVKLDLLETALRKTRSPALPRKKKQQHNDFLVVALADVYERNSARKASVTNNPVTDKREGSFVSFVMSFAEHFLPDQTPDLNARAIQRALKVRKDNPEGPAVT